MKSMTSVLQQWAGSCAYGEDRIQLSFIGRPDEQAQIVPN